MGLDQDAVRSWIGCYRQITLVMLAPANFPGICAQHIPLASPVRVPEASATRDARPRLPLPVVFRASSAWMLDLASSQQGEAGGCLVLLATLAAEWCQLFP